MRPRFPSLAAALASHAATHPDDGAYVFLDDAGAEAAALTFSQLHRRAAALASALLERASPGDRALLAFPPGLDFLVAFFACHAAGLIAVPTILPRAGRPLRDSSRKIVEDCAPRLGLTTSSALEAVRAAYAPVPGAAALQWVGADGGLTNRPLDRPLPDPAAIALLQYTSGSTSAPKGVMVSHGNLAANVEQISQGGALDRRSARVGWIPLFHDMGLIFNALEGTWVGALCVLMSPQAFVARPLLWLQAIHRYRAEMVIAPNFAYDLCLERYDAGQLEGVDLSCLALALNGAEPVRADTIEGFAATFAPHGLRPTAPRPTYGMAEATLQISVGRRGTPPRLWTVGREALVRHRALPPAAGERRQVLVSCGRPLPGEEVAVVDPESRRRLSPGQVGEIWVSGPNVAQGYWQKPDATRETFQARIEGEAPRDWLRTGDLGCLDPDGELYVTGRIKDVIIVRGSNFYPQDLELTAEKSHPALRRGHSAAFTVESADGRELLAIACEVRAEQLGRASPDEIAGAVRQAAVAEHELTVHKVICTTPGSIPRTTSGKIRRGATRELWQRGELPVAPPQVGAPPPQQAVAAPGREEAAR